MKKIYIKEDTSVNWIAKYGVHALDMTSKKFERSSDICGDDNLVINIIDDINKCVEEDNISKQIQQIEFDGYSKIEFLLFYNYSLVGYVEKIDGFGL